MYLMVDDLLDKAIPMLCSVELSHTSPTSRYKDYTPNAKEKTEMHWLWTIFDQELVELIKSGPKKSAL